METPIIEGNFMLKRGEGKGAWTFIEMPILENVPKKRNSTVRIRGTIDAFELRDFHIWAMKKGTFMAVKADIRKIIKKEAGDTVSLVLYLDEPQMAIPEDFMECLREEPKLLARFEKQPEKERQATIDWIFSAKTEDEKIARMAKVMEKLEEVAGR